MKTSAETALHVEDLDKAIAQLPDEQREVLLLIALEGMTYAQVAAILGIPIGTVMSRLHRARERLRGWLDGDQSCGLRRVK
jgi:RNA polymerase sigma-70 factor (ECF subfamily)